MREEILVRRWQELRRYLAQQCWESLLERMNYIEQEFPLPAEEQAGEPLASGFTNEQCVFLTRNFLFQFALKGSELRSMMQQVADERIAAAKVAVFVETGDLFHDYRIAECFKLVPAKEG